MARRTPPNRRTDILAAARDEFAARGYAAARLEDVAARLGLSKAALYLQFDDKAALFLGVIDSLLAENLPVVIPATLADAAATTQLRALISGAMTQLASGDLNFLPRLVIGEAGNFPEIARAWHDRAVVRVLGAIEAIIRRGIARGEFRTVNPALAARSVAGGMMFATLWRTTFEPVGAEPIDLAAFAASHADILIGGLANSGAAS
jgi:AcrR family transcriptional regulator